MGRGRQKAKHTKVARELKYFSPDTDLSALQSELGKSTDSTVDLEKWADYATESANAESTEERDDEAQSA